VDSKTANPPLGGYDEAVRQSAGLIDQLTGLDRSSVTQLSANTYVEESRCTKGINAESRTRVTYTYQGDTASHTEMRMTLGTSEALTIADAKYLRGACCGRSYCPGSTVARPPSALFKVPNTAVTARGSRIRTPRSRTYAALQTVFVCSIAAVRSISAPIHCPADGRTDVTPSHRRQRPTIC
jgi:hypothetical protein